MTHTLLDELRWRGLLYQHTEGVAALLQRGVASGYVGFDPTAASLHVGHLLPIMGLVHLQRSGHRPIALVGGGTGLIGDPSGRAAERALLSVEQVDANVRGIRAQLEHFLNFDDSGGNGTAAILVDNAEWLRSLRTVEFMRDVGKHFTVNIMLQKESVKARLDAGISYTEFSYMLLQAYDFLELHRRYGVLLQLGGSDQWGNITAGIELIRRTEGAEAQCATLPLVTTASGAKFGKSEAGAVWLDASLTSPYEFYQFWLNVDDRDVGRYLRYFTLFGREEIESLDQTTGERPERREAQQALARHMTTRVHGEDALGAALEVTGFLFGGLEPASLSSAALDVLSAEAPFVEVKEADVSDGAQGLDVLKLLVASGLAASNGAARRLLEQGGISVNKRKLGAQERFVDSRVLLHGSYLILGKGKRDYAVVRLLR
ncbi:MAG TPA: tyrosine--tRNA ligase [Gemmatimonadaceae bacterium]|nr:tyrosine--tRNA ligase [Gemmatimonadaceae bacterium]